MPHRGRWRRRSSTARVLHSNAADATDATDAATAANAGPLKAAGAEPATRTESALDGEGRHGRAQRTVFMLAAGSPAEQARPLVVECHLVSCCPMCPALALVLDVLTRGGVHPAGLWAVLQRRRRGVRRAGANRTHCLECHPAAAAAYRWTGPARVAQNENAGGFVGLQRGGVQAEAERSMARRK